MREKDGDKEPGWERVEKIHGFKKKSLLGPEKQVYDKK
jgi:hypothetical protein